MTTILSSLILLLVTLLVPVASASVRRDTSYCVWTVAILFLYCCVSAGSAYYIDVKGTGNDAQVFHERAVAWAAQGEWMFATSHELYTQILGSVYRITGASIFIGQQLSIIAFALFTIVLKKYIVLLRLHQYRISILAIASLLPSMMFRATATLREAYEVLLIAACIYLGVRIVINNSWRDILYFAFCTGMLAIVHKALTLYAIVIVLIFTTARQPTRGIGMLKKNKVRVVGVGTSLAVGLLALVVVFGDVGGLQTTNLLLTGDFERIDQVLEHKATKEARATYGTKVDLGSIGSFLKTLPVSYINYTVAPFPWQVRVPLDIYGSILGLLRLVLFIYAVRFWRDSIGETRRAAALILLGYVTLSILWAIGTSNYGTADRHNITHFWMLLLLGYPGFARTVKKMLYGTYGTRMRW